MKVAILDGTPEEIIKVVRALYPDAGSLMATVNQVEPSPTTDESSTDEPTNPEAPKTFVSMEFARHVLKRRPLSNAQPIALRGLAEGYPEWVTRDELCAATGYTAHQLAGVMGALGRRVSHTKGYSNGARFFDKTWNDSAGAWDYRLPETVLEALRLENLI